tara:strand:+ start:1120 stop:1341 length:222 start_codon:yes stop_codon:yes gene_type:complete
MKPVRKKENPEERRKHFKRLTSEERKVLIREKLKIQGLEEGSGVKEKDQASYDRKEIIDLIYLTRCLLNNKNS